METDLKSSFPQIINRFGEPSKMDSAQFGTICKVGCTPESVDIYLQISHDDNEPNWTYMGSYSTLIDDQAIYNNVHKVLQSNQL